MSSEQYNDPRPPSLVQRTLSPVPAASLIAVTTLVVVLVIRLDIPLGDAWDAIRNIKPSFYLLAVLTHCLTFLFRGARWRLLMANAAQGQEVLFTAPSLKYSTSMMFISWFVTSVTVFRMGDAFRAYAYARDTASRLSGSIGTVLADRMADFVTVLSLMAIAILFLLLEGSAQPKIEYIAIGLALLGGMGLTLAAMLLFRTWVAHRLPERLRSIYLGFHIGTIGSFRNLHWVFILGALGWTCEVGTWFFVLEALGAQVSLGLILFIPVANAFLVALQLTPGSLGVLELGVTSLLHLQLPIEVALAAALVDRTLMILSMATGGLMFVARQVKISTRPAK